MGSHFSFRSAQRGGRIEEGGSHNSDTCHNRSADAHIRVNSEAGEVLAVGEVKKSEILARCRSGFPGGLITESESFPVGFLQSFPFARKSHNAPVIGMVRCCVVPE